MNYCHAFHAGNFADVVKHAILVRVLVHLRAKPALFRVLDTHAGAGLYDLAGPQASRGAEWREGIARLIAASAQGQARTLLAPYLDAVAALNAPDQLTLYPGSPMLARAFLRQTDRLLACELEPRAASALAGNLRGDPRCKAIAIDGWTAEFRHLEHALVAAHRKWATGIYLLWYPIKDRHSPDVLARGLRTSGIANILRAEIDVAVPRDRLHACGLVLVNPPWKLESEIKLLLPALVAALAKGNGGSHRLDWLAREK